MVNVHLNCVYLYLHKRMIESARAYNLNLTFDEAWRIIWLTKIPRKLFYNIIQEMENMGLIKKINKFNLKIINEDKSKLLEYPSKLSHMVGLW